MVHLLDISYWDIYSLFWRLLNCLKEKSYHSAKKMRFWFAICQIPRMHRWPISLVFDRVIPTILLCIDSYSPMLRDFKSPCWSIGSSVNLSDDLSVFRLVCPTFVFLAFCEQFLHHHSYPTAWDWFCCVFTIFCWLIVSWKKGQWHYAWGSFLHSYFLKGRWTNKCVRCEWVSMCANERVSKRPFFPWYVISDVFSSIPVYPWDQKEEPHKYGGKRERERERQTDRQTELFLSDAMLFRAIENSWLHENH